MNQPGRNPGFLWPLLGIGLYVALGLLVLGHHEMWRDEFQAWLIAKKSQSLRELWQNTRYEGHPLLWFLTLYGLTRFTVQPEAMKVLHFLVAVASVALIWRYAPFSSGYKALITFGYFFFYEYAVISRNYAQGVLLVLLFLSAYRPYLDKPYSLLAGLLALLCQTSIYGLILALCLGGFLALELCQEKPDRQFWHNHRWPLILSLLLFLAGVGFGLYSVLPPSDLRPPVGGGIWVMRFDPAHLTRTLAQIWRSYLPVPDFRYQFWESNLVSSKIPQALLGIGLFGFFLLGFRKISRVFWLYVTGTAGLLAFMYLIYTASLRHAGHLYILLIACWWLAELSQEMPLGSRVPEPLCSLCQSQRTKVMAVLLTAQVLAAGLAAFYDWRYPFSASREVAAYINQNGLASRFLAGDIDYAVSPLAAYLDREIYYLSKDGWGSFVVWNNRRKKPSAAELAVKLKELASRYPHRLLVILNYPLPQEISFLKLKRAFTQSIRWDEIYYLYENQPERG